MRDVFFAKKLLLQAGAWLAVALLIFWFFGKTMIFFAVKAGIKIIGAVLFGLVVLFRKIFRRQS